MAAAAASASPGASKKSPLLLEAMGCDRARAHIRGYLRKRNRHDQWQKRFFEVVDHYFVYYKRADSPDMLCAMDLYQADPPRVLPGPPGPDGRPQNSGAFCINYDRDRTFKASSAEDAERWVGVILAVQRANPAHARAPPAPPEAAGPAADDADKAGGAARSPGGAEIESSGSATGQPRGCCAVM
ncbi:hypothetical protein FNF29_02293 [Cafeteria roenbergensis]|uniref:PH domain-containing protein n=1 Tax=Cafeteria roenbergensis TaxID=33653 RepID=A0A5A8CQP7_CAFRO|nr:hypothetical protein FNF29_02293 [Cafeteria roenbergensis]|eukprot:KAA0154764.1 hypothetical protein FNF29_02293 [Cafeteria roenbergensis]